MAQRIQSHVLEKVIGLLMIVFGVAAAIIFMSALANKQELGPQMAIIEILLIVILSVLAQTVIMIRIYEQNLELLERKK